VSSRAGSIGSDFYEVLIWSASYPPTETFAAGVLYHVTVRGNQRQKIFTAESDYQAYLERQDAIEKMVMFFMPAV
jgi:hypothetical protein